MAKYKSEDNYIALNLIAKYKNEITDKIQSSMNENERKQLRALWDLINDNKYVIKAMTEEFSLDNAPEYVLLFDMERNKFWKQNKFGYTADVFMAGEFKLSEAKSIAEKINSNTKIVYF